jgi:hypothetical protein
MQTFNRNPVGGSARRSLAPEITAESILEEIRGIRDVVDELASSQESIQSDLAGIREVLDAQQEEF